MVIRLAGFDAAVKGIIQMNRNPYRRLRSEAKSTEKESTKRSIL
jgi:hypothetical protein